MFRIAWILFLVVEGIFFLFGIGDVIMGANADPAIVESLAGEPWTGIQETTPLLANIIDLYARSQGFTILMLSVLSILMTLYVFKQGVKWAWFAHWIWPLWMAYIFIQFYSADLHPDFAAPPPMISAPIFFVITFIAQVLSYRKFFPKEKR